MPETAGRRLLVRSATRYLGALHRLAYRVSGGRIGGRIWGLQVVLLTTTGRRSGKPRTVPLCSLRDGDDLVVFASYGGLDQPPAWWLNLEASPDAELLTGRERRAVTARNANPAERTRLWAELTARAPGYLEYERRTTREIPVVICSTAIDAGCPCAEQQTSRGGLNRRCRTSSLGRRTYADRPQR